MYIHTGFEFGKQNGLAKNTECRVEKGLPQTKKLGFANHFMKYEFHDLTKFWYHQLSK